MSYNDVHAAVIVQCTNEWQTLDEIIFAVNGPRELTIQEQTIKKALVSLYRKGALERTHLNLPTKKRVYRLKQLKRTKGSHVKRDTLQSNHAK